VAPDVPQLNQLRQLVLFRRRYLSRVLPQFRRYELHLQLPVNLLLRPPRHPPPLGVRRLAAAFKVVGTPRPSCRTLFLRRSALGVAFSCRFSNFHFRFSIFLFFATRHSPLATVLPHRRQLILIQRVPHLI